MVHHIDDSFRMYSNCLHHRPSTHHHQPQQIQRMFAPPGSVSRTGLSEYYDYMSPGVVGPSPTADEALSPGLRHPQSNYSLGAARHMQNQYYPPTGVDVYHPNQSAGVQTGGELMTQQQQQHGSPTGGGTPSGAWMFATSPGGQGGSNDSGAGSPTWPDMCNRYNGGAGPFRHEDNIDMMSNQHQDRSPPGDGTYTLLHRINADQHHHHSLTPSANTSTVSPLQDSAALTGNVNVGAAGLHVVSAVRRQLQNDAIRSTHSGSIGSGGALGTASDWGQSQSQPQHGAPYDWMRKQTYPAITPSGKTRTKDKYRIVYTELQKVELEKEFLFNQYITIQRKAELAGTIGLSDRQVKIWFQNRRAKERKHKRKREEVGGPSRSGSSSATARGVITPSTNTSMHISKPPSVDATSRLRSQLQMQQRCNDVIKMETVGPELMTSPVAQSNNLYPNIQ